MSSVGDLVLTGTASSCFDACLSTFYDEQLPNDSLCVGGTPFVSVVVDLINQTC